MRKNYVEYMVRDENLTYRGAAGTRLNNLTDAVFGIALTLLIFNVADADSFADLLIFAKSLPALLVSIVFLFLIWKEHVSFVLIYAIRGSMLQALNILFIALVIFYVYPLRFLTRLLTNIFFNTNIELKISTHEIPELMIFYGFVAFALYFVLFLFYTTVLRQKQQLELSPYEVFYTKAQRVKMVIMALVPFISLSICYLLKDNSIAWASIIGGCTYWLYPILIQLWVRNFNKKRKLILSSASDKA